MKIKYNFFKTSDDILVDKIDSMGTGINSELLNNRYTVVLKDGTIFNYVDEKDFLQLKNLFILKYGVRLKYEKID